VLRDEQPVPARRQVHRDREWWLPLYMHNWLGGQDLPGG
jgi:hypothetical protein